MTAGQRARERERKRRAAAKERGRKLLEAARARARKIVEAARARARAWLAAATRPRAKEGKPSAKRRTKTKAKPKVRRMKQPTETETILLSALRQVAGRSRGLQSCGDVRRVAKLPKSVFDAEALRLARERKLVLHEHDFPQSLSATKRAELVEDGKGAVFVGMALPLLATELPELKLLNKARLYGAGAPVRIATLRKDVGLTDSEFDVALGVLQRLQKVALYRDDNRATAKDAGAYFVGGEPRHILYVKD